MEAIDAFVHMGGYGGYVWPAYGLAVVLLALVLLTSLAAARRAEADLEQLQRTRRDRRGAKTEDAA